MKYGEWQLRDDSAYWKSQNIIVYPSTNSVDEGMIHSENNVRSIVRRITTQSYALRPNCFTMSSSADRSTITVSPGEGNIQGYHIITNAPISIKVPSDTTAKQWTLGISLSYDAANNVTGDVVAYDKPIGDNEIFSGAYLYWFDKCQLKANYDRILVIGRVWAENGVIVDPGTTIKNTDSDNGRVIENPIETDPHKELAVDGSAIRIFTNSLDSTSDMGSGVIRTKYDTLPENITNIKQYDSMKYPVTLDRKQYTKPPVFGTSLQDFINYIPDWYVSKYGDYMTGALRMDHLSIDRKIELDEVHAEEYKKDSTAPGNGAVYSGTEGIFISPRTLGQLAISINKELTSISDIDELYQNGGTIMSVVPRSYANGIDNSNNLTYGVRGSATYAALVSQTVKPNATSTNSVRPSDTGLIIHTSVGGHSKVSMYDQTANLRIENVSTAGGKSAIDMIDGRVYIDSFNNEGIILHSAIDNNHPNVDFTFINNRAIIRNHQPATDWGSYPHSSGFVTNLSGENTSDDFIEMGISFTYDNPDPTSPNSFKRTASAYSSDKKIKDPYLQIGNLRLRSNDSSKITSLSDSKCKHRVNTIEAVNLNTTNWSSTIDDTDIRGINDSAVIPFVRVMPGVYSRNTVLEDYLQVGTSKPDDMLGIDTTVNTLDKIYITKNNDRTVFEQDQTYDEESIALNKMVPRIWKAEANSDSYNTNSNYYQDLGGFYSNDNIGCSSTLIPHHSNTLPYTPTSEWVRFTRFRYDEDNDYTYGGQYDISEGDLRTRKYGSTYNIEFNTTVKNARANQIIWNYHPADGNNIDKYQPLTLSYVHDEYDSSLDEDANGTHYPADYYYDFNGYLHRDPTFGVRDFLRIDGGGLSVHGDVNNPALSGDHNPENANKRPLGITILHGRMYGCTYNDYAETYKKADPAEVPIEGMLVALDPETQLYKICDTAENSLVVGVISDNYGLLLGGKRIDGVLDEIDMVSQREYFAVGVSGKVLVNVDKDVALGDLLTSSSVRGLATPVDKNNITPGTIVGKVVSLAQEVDGKPYKQCLMQIMLA